MATQGGVKMYRNCAFVTVLSRTWRVFDKQKIIGNSAIPFAETAVLLRQWVVWYVKLKDK
jgi:hypothetical protein